MYDRHQGCHYPGQAKKESQWKYTDTIWLQLKDHYTSQDVVHGIYSSTFYWLVTLLYAGLKYRILTVVISVSIPLITHGLISNNSIDSLSTFPVAFILSRPVTQDSTIIHGSGSEMRCISSQTWAYSTASRAFVLQVQIEKGDDVVPGTTIPDAPATPNRSSSDQISGE